jgi:hypothetical protein
LHLARVLGFETPAGVINDEAGLPPSCWRRVSRGSPGWASATLICSALATVAEYRVSLNVAMFVALIRASYPLGIPTTDYRALLALVRRRLSDDEIAALATDLMARGELKLDIDDFGAAITRISDKPPTAADLERVQRRLGGDWLAG